MNAFLALAALVGATLILVRGSIFNGLRKWSAPRTSLLHCAQCTGFWVGGIGRGIVGGGLLGPLDRPTLAATVMDVLMVGLATSVLSQLTDAVLLNLLGDPEE